MPANAAHTGHTRMQVPTQMNAYQCKVCTLIQPMRTSVKKAWQECTPPRRISDDVQNTRFPALLREVYGVNTLRQQDNWHARRSAAGPRRHALPDPLEPASTHPPRRFPTCQATHGGAARLAVVQELDGGLALRGCAVQEERLRQQAAMRSTRAACCGLPSPSAARLIGPVPRPD
jgi:hypothetical protein